MHIETPRLIIRDFTLEDIQSLYTILSDKEVMHFSLNGPYSFEKTERFVKDCMNAYSKLGYAQYAVVLKESNELMGYCGFFIQIIDEQRESELAYRLAKKFWQTGFGSEAAKACRDYGFKTLKLKRLIACIEPKNIASIRVAEKVGMHLEKNIHFHGVPIFIYAMENKV